MAWLKKQKKSKKQSTTPAVPSTDFNYISKQLYRQNVELAHTNQMLSLLRKIDELVLLPQNRMEDLSEGIAQAIVHESNAILCGLFVRGREQDKAVFSLRGLVVRSADKESRLSLGGDDKRLHLRESWYDSDEESSLISVRQALNEESSPFLKGGMSNLSRAFADQNVRTLYVLKLITRDDTVGILLVGLGAEKASLQKEDRAFYDRLARAIGVAVDNKLLFEENQEVLRKLKVTNQKLKELSDAKDDFISMASHQLRTPLTSMKGYVSMVLDGDAGKVSEKQRSLLSESFASAQRMVYLISDLLNVSRMKTGKFIIEPVESYLPDVVEQEINQLHEAAHAKNMTINFDKPKTFPKLMLDETKIRQVIMNFVDNALYYTPAGGTIGITLEALKDHIEFKDTSSPSRAVR